MVDTPINGDSEGRERKNVIVNYIPPDITETFLQNMFGSCGSIVGCKLMRDKTSGVSLGYAFVNYSHEEEAARAIEKFDGQQLSSKKIRVSYARPSSEEIKNANLYVSGLPKAVSENDLKTWFGVYGTIISSKILMLENGESRGVGFIRFDKRAQAQAAMEALNGVSLAPGSTLSVKFANPPKGPQSQQMNPFNLQSPLNVGGVGPIHHETANNRFSPMGTPGGFSRGAPNFNAPHPASDPNLLATLHLHSPSNQHCVFVYGLPTSVEETENELLLYRLFAPHGAILSIFAKKGVNYGFVNMIRYDEALKAVMNLNGYFVQQHNTRLQVSFKKNKPLQNMGDPNIKPKP